MDWEPIMLNEYLRATMRHCQVELLEDGTYFASIPGFDGLWSNATTVEDCQQQLCDALDDWVLLGLKLGHPLPVVDGIDLNLDLTPQSV